MAYEIEDAFRAIEDDLIDSMIRNMKHHRAEETREGFEWTSWQTLQLNALREYSANNKKKYTKQFADINAKIEEEIRQARLTGNMDAEIEILEAIKKGFKASKVAPGMQAEFFRVNDRKLDALIEATKNDMQKAEHAMLRMADDQYRQVIFNAQVYANTGAGTYEKAVDMATRDYLSRGINCIQYKNGARVDIAAYAAMAIRTANTRAYLNGEGEKRREWGISTVIVNKRGHACLRCLKWTGRVLIDDVWSGGKKEDGEYPLMSTAMAQGLYHPNCKDIHTTFFPGITEEPKPLTRQEVEESKADYMREQEINYANRQKDKFKRLADGALDPDDKAKYKAKAKEWSERVKLVEEYEYPLNETNAHFIKIKEVNKIADSMGIHDFNKNINPELAKEMIDEVAKIQETFGGAYVKSISLLDPNMTYDGLYESGRISLKNITGKNAKQRLSEQSKKMFDSGVWSTKSYLHTVRHESGHGVLAWMQQNNPIEYDLKISRISDIMNNKKKQIINSIVVDSNNINSEELNLIQKQYGKQLSAYAFENVHEFIAESIAEYMNGKKCRSLAKEVVNVLLEV